MLNKLIVPVGVVLAVVAIFILPDTRLSSAQELSESVCTHSGISQVAAQIYANESFARVRGSVSVESQVSGSSMIVRWEEKKYILTNFHVVQSMVDLYIEDLKTGNIYQTRVIGRDPALDLALLLLPKELEHLAESPFADALVGETVFAIGFPFGKRNITQGIITSNEFAHAIFLLSQVPLNSGNSGGPLLNVRQEVVGINTAYRQEANLYSFSVPSSFVQKIMPQLVVEGTIVRHAHPRLRVADFRGLLPRNFSDMGISYPIKKPGVVVFGFHDPAASQQGIEIGDIILSVDGVRTETFDQYVQHLLFSYKSGQRAKFLLLRGSEEVTVDVKLSPLTLEQ